jgi:putative DNA primase/helicase
MFAAKNGAAVRRLWEGDTSAYPSPSEADLALCGRLAFWTGGNASRIDALFRQSGLYREDKWHDRDDYREPTIAKALELQDFYRPRSRPGDNDPWLGPRGARAGIPLTVRRA